MAEPLPAPQADPKIIWTVVLSISVLTLTGLGSLVVLAFLKIENPMVVTAIVTITSNLSGALTALLVSVKSQPSSDPPKTLP